MFVLRMTQVFQTLVIMLMKSCMAAKRARILITVFIYFFFPLTASCKTGDNWIIRLQTPLGPERRASFSEGKEKNTGGRYFLLENDIHAHLLVVCLQWFTLAQ